MRAVISEVRADFIEERRQRGLDLWDEMWEGTLHMPPMPTIQHQSFEFRLQVWLDENWATVEGRRVYHDINVAPRGGWPKNYRIPDVVLLDSDCPAKERGQYLEGPPTVAIEIHSPGDEAYEKLPFYANLGVPEVWIIDRDSRAAEIHALRRRKQVLVTPDEDGWLRSAATGIQMRTQRRKLAIQMIDDPASLKLLPDK